MLEKKSKKISAIIINPDRTDLPLLERIYEKESIGISCAILGKEASLGSWLSDNGIETCKEISEIEGKIKPNLIIYLGKDRIPEDIYNFAAKSDSSLIDRKTAEDITANIPPSHQTEEGNPEEVLFCFSRLLESYSPISDQSSTAVKLTACLTEACSLWQCDVGAIFTSREGSDKLHLRARKNFPLNRGFSVPKEGTSLVSKSFTEGRAVISSPDVSDGEVLPGLKDGSWACVPIESDGNKYGVLLLWSKERGKFSENDLPAISLFAKYVSIISRFKEFERSLEKYITIDSLTGMPKRKQFEERLSHEVERAERYKLVVSLIIFDIDHLDEYNQSCGHMLGNLAIADIANLLKKNTRRIDFIARIGEDEFGVILPQTHRLGAMRLGDRLREEVANYPFPTPEGKSSRRITVSGGVSTFPSNSSSYPDMLSKAYKALEMAKGEGGNNVKLSS
ncbi:MAG: sensor domain-containing diguanylate cyclase [Actinomycetota bacterium]|nr:sensor domain-containing diguanylate cyclase [Actinomycetota bacterium]